MVDEGHFVESECLEAIVRYPSVNENQIKEFRRIIGLGDFVRISGSIERMKQQLSIENNGEHSQKEESKGLLLHIKTLEPLKKHGNTRFISN